jgi:hypothetical protein
LLVLALLVGCGSTPSGDTYHFRGPRTGLFESLWKPSPVDCIIEGGSLKIRFDVDDDRYPQTGRVILEVSSVPEAGGERVLIGGGIMTHSSAEPGTDLDSIVAGLGRTFPAATSISVGRRATGNVAEIAQYRVVYLHGLHFEATELTTTDGSIPIPESRVEDVVLFCSDQREIP